MASLTSLWWDRPVEFLETLLPGVGVRYDATTASGQSVSLVVDRDGAAEIVGYRSEDPDAVAHRIKLTATETGAIAELLGASRLNARMADLSREVPGLGSARVRIAPGSRYDGRHLGDTKARTRTGCSIVALVRGTDVRAAPGPLARLVGGDIVVAIGSDRGLAELEVLLAMSPEDEPLPVPDPIEE